jgi:fructose-bisphosphate aldolase class I
MQGSDKEGSANLDAIDAIGPHPWKLAFPYGRALHAARQHGWAGEKENLAAGRRAFAGRDQPCRAVQMEREA